MPATTPSGFDDLAEYLQFHTARGYYLKRNAVAGCLIFVWVATLVGLYRFDLALLTPVLVGAMAAWALVRRAYHRFRNKNHYFMAVAFIDNLFVTAAVYGGGGAGSAAIFTFYVFPIIFHSLSRQRRHIYFVANMAALMYTTTMVLECTGVLPYRNVLGYAQPPPWTYVGLVAGAFLMLNLAALTGDSVTQAFAKLWHVKQQLEDSQRRLRSLTAETQFIASAISHELKNPLSAAANAADLIAEADVSVPEEMREFAGIVRHNVTKAYDMLTDLRQLLFAVREDETPQTVPLTALVQSVVREISVAGKLDGAVIAVAPELPNVRGRPQKLAQLFRNLLLNAIEHGRSNGRATVRLECFGDDATPGFLRFGVSDDGPGVPAEHRERIFEPFVSFGAHDGKGRGLGLALGKRIVEDNGGRIWVEPRQGGGACFLFTLPAEAR